MKYSKEDKKLISSFVQAQKDIEHFYLQALREKNPKKAKYYADQAKALVDLLQEEYQSWALTRWSQEYLKGFKQVEHLKRGVPKQTVELGEDQIMLQVGKFHKQALLALVQNGNRVVSATLDGMKKDIVYGLALFNQKGKEIWLQHQIQSQLGAGILTGKALHYQKSDLVAFFQKKGLQLRDRSGRKRDPHTYAEMLIRTETARAYNAGIINRALELWTSKFRIEESWNCCSICAQYNGKVVDINKGGYDLPPYHPNCRGTIVPVWEEGEDRKDNHFPNQDIAKHFEWEIGKVNKKYWGSESPIGTINEIVIRKYTNNDWFSSLNTHLRENKTLNQNDSFISKTLDRVIANNLDYKQVVYRWVDIDKSKLKNIISSLEWKELGFVSTSKDEKVARVFASQGEREKIILKIHHKWGMDIEKYSNYPEEQEVLLWKNKTFRITWIQKKSDFTYLTLMENG